MAESTVVAALVLRLVRQFGALADLGREDQQVAIYDQLRLLISSVVLSDISVVKQVISLASPVAIILANSKAQPSEATKRLKDALALVELYIAAAKTQHDVVMLASEEVKLDIMIAKSYEDRLALAPEEKDLCLRAQYFWSAALSVSTKYGILDWELEIRNGLDKIEAKYVSLAVSPSQLQSRLQLALYKNVSKFPSEFSLVERIGRFMIQRDQLSYAQRLFDSGLLQTVLNYDKPTDDTSPCAFVTRALTISAEINNKILGVDVSLPHESRLDSQLWWSYREELSRLRIAAGKSDATADLQNTRLNFNKGLIKMMAKLWDTAVELLGAPPCAFSVFSMGSLSRMEAAPYSDIEYGMIIPQERFRDHVYWKNIRDFIEFEIGCFGERYGLHVDDQGTPSRNPALIGTPAQLLHVITQNFDVNAISLANSILHPSLLFAWAPPQESQINLFSEFVSERNRVLLQPGSLPGLSSPNSHIGPHDPFHSPVPSIVSTIQTQLGGYVASVLNSVGTQPHQSRPQHVLPSREYVYEHLGLFFLADHAQLATTRWVRPSTFPPGQKETIELKPHFIQPLAYIVADLCLITGVACGTAPQSSVSTVDLVDRLAAEHIIGPDFAMDLRDAIEFLYSLKLRAHIHCREQNENDSVYYLPNAEQNQGHCVCSRFYEITFAERCRLELVEWSVLRPLFNVLPLILESHRSLLGYIGHSDPEKRVRRSASQFSSSPPLPSSSPSHTHSRHLSLSSPGGPTQTDASSCTPPAKPSSPDSTGSLDPPLAMVALSAGEPELCAMLKACPHSALKCLIFALFKRKVAPHIHRRYFRVIARISHEDCNYRREYHRILNQDARVVFQSNEKTVESIDLVLAMCDSYPDEHGSRLLFNEAQRSWEQQIADSTTAEDKIKQISSANHPTSTLKGVAIDLSSGLVRGAPNDDSTPQELSFIMSMHLLLSRLIGYGLPRMILRVTEQSQPLLLMEDCSQHLRLSSYLAQSDVDQICLPFVSCATCSNCRNFSDLVLISILCAPSLSPEDIFLQPHQDSVSRECSSCTHRMMILPQNPRIFFEGLVNPVINASNPTGQMQLNLKNILFCLPAMHNSVNRHAAKEFCSLWPPKLLGSWVRDVHTLSGKTDSFQLPLGASAALFKRMEQMQTFLRDCNYRATHLDLLRFVHPLVGLAYKKLLSSDEPALGLFRAASAPGVLTENGIFRASAPKVMVDELSRVEKLKSYQLSWMPPMAAKTELEDAIAAERDLKNAVTQLKLDPAFASDHLPSIKTLPVATRSALQQIDYSTVSNPRHRQNLINLSLDIAPETMESVCFVNSMDIDRVRLVKLVRAQAHTVTSLDLSGCSGLRSSSLFITIAELCTNLRYMNVSRTALCSVGKVQMVIGSRTPCVFHPSLQFFVADHMSHLSQVIMVAPGLRHFSVQSCPLLKEMRISTATNQAEAVFANFNDCKLFNGDLVQIFTELLPISQLLGNLSEQEVTRILPVIKNIILGSPAEIMIENETFSEHLLACFAVAIRASKIQRFSIENCRFTVPLLENLLKAIVKNQNILEVRIAGCPVEGGLDAALSSAAVASAERAGLRIQIEP